MWGSCPRYAEARRRKLDVPTARALLVHGEPSRVAAQLRRVRSDVALVLDEAAPPAIRQVVQGARAAR